MSAEYKINDSEQKKIAVTNEFIEIYQNFNVSSQIDKMNNLSKKELYLLLLLCIDNHSEEDPVCINNYKPFTSEITEVLDLQDDKNTSNLILIELVTETDDKYIDVDLLVDSSGNKLPDPLEKEEVRDVKIHTILDKPE